MKQTLLSRLILAGLAGAAMSAAQAGQIQASSVSIAREVITTDTQAVIAPSIAYRFAGDVDARVQAQTLQVQFTLAAGAWGTLPGTLANAISMSDGVSGVIQDQSAAAPVGVNASYTVVASGKFADANGKSVVWATITVNQGATALVKQPIFSLNVTSNTIAGVAATNVSAGRAPVTGLYTVSGDMTTDGSTCEAVKTLGVSFKHYVALTSPASAASDTTATPDEHTRSGATNAATIMTFPTNLKVAVTASTADAFLTAGGNLTFADNAAVVGTSYIDGNTVLLGKVAMKQNATGYDSDLANQYLLAGGGAGVLAAATAVNNIGRVEAKQLDIKISGTQGFVKDGVIYASTTANCAAAVAGTVTTWTAANVAGPVTLTIPTAVLNATLGAATGTADVFVCYGTTANANAAVVAANTNTIPSSAFSAIGTLVKAAAGANLNEQNNTCNGPLYSLGGGLKIDVRNYASSAETSGYQSVLRFINNSDAAAADVWAQFVHQNGKLGNFAKIADVPVRGTLNMTAKQIDAMLAAGSAATAAIGTAAPVAQPGTATSSDTAPRLRITSTTGKSLRVQNYLFNAATGQILEASGQQGVDFEGTTTRAPGSEGQYQDQDANSGLNLGN